MKRLSLLLVPCLLLSGCSWLDENTAFQVYKRRDSVPTLVGKTFANVGIAAIYAIAIAAAVPFVAAYAYVVAKADAARSSGTTVSLYPP